MLQKSFIASLAWAMALSFLPSSVAFTPTFTGSIQNLSTPVGRDAVFSCTVERLGGYRVGWVKAETKAIQAIHNHVITNNPRISVSHIEHTTWNLHIHNVQLEDKGHYMCQINTDPMQFQVGSLDVAISPDFDQENTSGDTVVTEGGNVTLKCKAKGHPEPHVLWRREHGRDILIKDPTGMRITAVSSYQGEILYLTKILRTEMGAYMCIASNGIPPTVSKRIVVNVQFRPVVQVPNQLVGAPLGTDVTLDCYIEASPKPITYWSRQDGEMIVSSEKHEVKTVEKSNFDMRLSLVIRNLQKRDLRSYTCTGKNSMGDMNSSVRVYEIPRPKGSQVVHVPDDDDDNDQVGSAEEEYVEVPHNKVERTRVPLLKPRGTASMHENRVPVDPVSSSSAYVTLSFYPAALLLIRI